LAIRSAGQCPAWSPVPGSAPGTIRKSIVFDDGGGAALYVSGTFTAIGGVPALHVARWDGTTWSAVGGGLAGTVSALAVFDDGSGPRLVAGGAEAGTARVWRLQGGAWNEIGNFPENIDGFAGVLALCGFDDGTGPRLYAGGLFDGDVLSWDGSTWTVPGGGLANAHLQNEPEIQAFLVHDDGSGSGPTLYAAGRGLHAREQPWAEISDNVARLQGGLWTSVGSGLGSTQSGADFVFALASYDDGGGAQLYAGGTFTHPTSRIARWDGSQWSEFGGGLGGYVTSLATLDDGSGMRLFAGGAFTTAGGQPAARVAAWDGAAWSPLGSGLGSTTGSALAFTLATFDAGTGRGPALFAAGSFTLAGGNPVEGAALWSGCGGDATAFCFGDGSATPCPCGNASPIGARAGCLHSFGTGATLRVRGRASIANDTLVLEGASMPDSSALYFQGLNLLNGGAGVTFGDGVKCTSGPFVRLGTHLNVEGASRHPAASGPPLSVQGLVAAPGARHYQVRYRNAVPFCTPETFNYSSAVTVVWGP
jgi:hypothetical protein